MKIRDWIGLVVAVVGFVVALHATVRAPRWWESAEPAAGPGAVPRVRPVAEVEVVEVAPWPETGVARELFASAVGPRVVPPRSAESTNMSGPVVTAGSDSAAPPVVRPRFELVGCAETARGWAALVRDRETAETALLCPGDLEPRWQARLVSLDRDSFLQAARIEMRELPAETVARANAPAGSSTAGEIGESAEPAKSREDPL